MDTSVHTLTPEQKRLVAMLKALSNPVRFQIMEMLATCQTCITNDIVLKTPLAQATISQHLKVLREADLIEGTTTGPATCYCINQDSIRWMKDQINQWLPRCC